MALSSILIILPVPHFFTQMGGIGGHIAHVAGVIRGLRKCGFEIRLLAHGADAFSQGGDVIRIELPAATGWIGRQAWNYRLVQMARAETETHPPAFAYVRYSRQFGPWMPVLKKLISSTPLVAEVNSLGIQDYSFFAPIERLALNSVDLIICVSENLKDIISRQFGHRIAAKTVVIPNGVDLERFRQSDETHPRSVAQPRAGYVGSLKDGYGLEELIMAAKRLHRAGIPLMLHLAGTGPAKQRLMKLADGNPRICFEGLLQTDSVPSFLKSLDLLVYTTSAANMFQSPIKMYEYMAAGRPIVAMRTPATEALIEDGVTGVLVDPGCPDALANGFVRVLSLQGRGGAMGRAAQREAFLHHGWDARMRTLLELMRERKFAV